MEIINITPEELRVAAAELRAKTFDPNGSELFPDPVPGKGALKMAKAYRSIANKFCKLADKLDADKLDAMTFCAAKGVQA